MQDHFNAPISNQRWKEERDPKLSIVILGFRKAALLRQAVESFCRTASTAHPYELILVLNGASEEVVDWAHSFLESNRIPLLLVYQASSRPGTARNAGVRWARAPITLFLDDDIICFQDMVSHTLEVMAQPEIAAAGGPNLTPPRRGRFETASGLLFSSWLGAFQMRQRYIEGADSFVDEHSLILCNLAFRTELFRAAQGFPRNFISNEENVVLQRLEKEGKQLWFTNKLAVYHERRSTVEGLCSQALKYGSGRAQNLLLLPSTMSWIYFLPTSFLLYSLLLPALVYWGGFSLLLPMMAYLFLSLLNAAVWSLRKRDLLLLGYFVLYPIVHFSYGWGFLKTWWKKEDFATEQVVT